VDEHSIDQALKLNHSRRFGLIDHGVVQRSIGSNDLTTSLERHIQKHSLFARKSPFANVIQRCVKFIDREFSQISEPAEIDSQHRDLSLSYELGGSQHRPISAQHDDQIDT